MSGPTGVRIRTARPSDLAAILSVHRSAFETDAESKLVERLVSEGDAVLSLVALENAVVVGHALLSKVSIREEGTAARTAALALAPVAVRAEAQGRGIGSLLVSRSLDDARDAGWPAVIVLGHPAFYPRFGFVPALSFGILPPWPEVPREAWMIAELAPGALASVSGVVEYAPAFDGL